MLSKLSRRQFAALLAVIGSLAFLAPAQAAEPENTMIVTLKDGDVTIALRPDLAPKHVNQIKALVREGAYDNVAFHRVIDGFMAQTGDVQFGDMNDGYDAGAAGTGGSDKPDLPAEFSSEPYVRGVVGMARAQNPDSANSQFFIMFAPNPGLDGQYTVVGTVESGMELVDKIKKGDADQNGVVSEPDRMLKVRIASDK
ncbi:peptidylprolyl isomerase [Mesorhizobium sp. LHD-90]|uniref:peptidylprolyl isomerase n=1 Tax=Mesorhizobium sp. LHD-90 TaxID=3071414 RepID=UPI0027E0F66A|nr:peptidylprolyl isomerase [Mesorhizobium sp. LHD-90]MDQ6432869.1 peptidylprolyl isomerase [Mesorhizobium sp. LHD-90]